MDANIISPYVRLAMYSTLPSGHIINSRVIYDYEIIYVQEGCCILTVDGEEYRCEKNDVVFLRPGITHSFRVPEDGIFVQPHIHFDAVYNENSKITPFHSRTLPL